MALTMRKFLTLFHIQVNSWSIMYWAWGNRYYQFIVQALYLNYCRGQILIQFCPPPSSEFRKSYIFTRNDFESTKISLSSDKGAYHFLIDLTNFSSEIMFSPFSFFLNIERLNDGFLIWLVPHWERNVVLGLFHKMYLVMILCAVFFKFPSRL